MKNLIRFISIFVLCFSLVNCSKVKFSSKKGTTGPKTTSQCDSAIENCDVIPPVCDPATDPDCPIPPKCDLNDPDCPNYCDPNDPNDLDCPGVCDPNDPNDPNCPGVCDPNDPNDPDCPGVCDPNDPNDPNCPGVCDPNDPNDPDCPGVCDPNDPNDPDCPGVCDPNDPNDPDCPGVCDPNDPDDPDCPNQCDPFTDPDMCMGPYLFFCDSFERSNVEDSSPTGCDTNPVSPYGWVAAINDQGSANGLNVDIKIEHKSMYPSSHKDRSVYFTGRAGGSVHDLYLIGSAPGPAASEAAPFTKMKITFDFQTVDLDSNEYLKFEICENTIANPCGTTPINKYHLRDNWITLSTLPRNTTSGNWPTNGGWQTFSIEIDLNQFSGSQFLFRVSSRMNEGLADYDFSPDATAIDHVRLEGIQ